MQALLKIAARMKVSADKAQLKVLEKAFSESQTALLKLAAPTIENIVIKAPALAIKVLQSMASFFPDALSE